MKKLGGNQKLLVILLAAVIGMIGVAYAAVPFYRLFCAATGYGGTTQRVGEQTPVPVPVAQTPVPERFITVSFDGNVDKNLPWDFGPDQRNIKVKLGETVTVTYHARNRSDKPLVGMATFNVQPDKSGQYFDKIQCFCFDKQMLKAGETASFPVQFYIDPALAQDHHSDDVQNITLSYTFFLAKDQSLAKAATLKN